MLRFSKIREIAYILKIKETGGFILIDALIGLIIITTALTAAVVAYQQSTKQVIFANNNGYATYLAKQALEKIKNNDRLQQDSSGNVVLKLPATQTITASGVQYTVSTGTIVADLGPVSSYLQPIQVTVAWKEWTTGQQRTIAMVDYCYFQPYVAPASSLSKFLPKHQYMFYSGMTDARYSTRSSKLASKNGYPDTTVNGYLYTPASSQYKLWDTCLDHSFNISGTASDSYDNRAVVTAWDSGDPLTFYNIDFLTLGTYNLTFSARNDAAAGAISLNETRYRDPNQWGLADSNKHYAINVLIDDKVVVQNVLVQASDSAFNSPYSGTYTDKTNGTTYTTKPTSQQIYYTADTLDENGNVQYLNSSGKVTNISNAKAMTVTASVSSDGIIQFIGMPPGNHSISLVWLNDTGDVSKAGKNGVAGTDANILIANMSLKKH